MRYKNNTESGIRVPIKQDDKPAIHMTFHPGEEKEVPSSSWEAANLMGLDAVIPKIEKKVVKKSFKSSIGKEDLKKVVETKKLEN